MFDDVYQRIIEVVRQEMEGTDPCHDFSHVMRVYNLCLYLAQYEENVDTSVLKIAALLHDIARLKEDLDPTGKIDHAVESAKIAEKLLKDLGFPETKINAVKHCIISHRFRTDNVPESIEAKILFDADKIDALGAIGIGRSFISVGKYKEKLYSTTPLDEYIRTNLVGGRIDGRIKDLSKHSPNLEFETKFKFIPNKLFTKKGREIAQRRLKFMKEFFETLKKEINGE